MSSNKSKFNKDKGAKMEVVKMYGEHEGDTGSPKVQIALLTERVTYLTSHAQKNKKDQGSKRGLIKILSQRRKMAKYLMKTAKDKKDAEVFLKKMGVSI
jgi:small subunit ribosomal protein S15